MGLTIHEHMLQGLLSNLQHKMGPEISRNAIVGLASQNKNRTEGLGGAGLGVKGRWGSFPDQQALSETCHIGHGPSLRLFVLCFPQ